MNILKKSLFILVVLTLCLYFLSVGLFAKGGYFYNKSLEQVLHELEYRADRLKSDVENLRLHSHELSTEDGIRDIALGLGYYVDGDTVYLFADSDVQEPYTSYNLEETEEKPFKPLSKPVCFLISFGVSLIISLLYTLVTKKEEPISEESDLQV